MTPVSDLDCPLDLSRWEPSAIIDRWCAAFVLAKGKSPNSSVYYRSGWYVFHINSWTQGRERRKSMEGMIWELEARPKATP